MKDQKITPKDKRKLDSLFESYSLIADDTYVFLCDMKYDYSRWSKELVDTFGLPSEYMYYAGMIWEEHIHPEDRRAYHEGVEAVFSGKQSGHDMQYRVMRSDGDCDLITCRGIVITDGEGRPAYFGGAIRNHSQKAHIDNVTGLRNQYGFFADLQTYIRNKTPIKIGMCGIQKLSDLTAHLKYFRSSGMKLIAHFPQRRMLWQVLDVLRHSSSIAYRSLPAM